MELCRRLKQHDAGAVLALSSSRLEMRRWPRAPTPFCRSRSTRSNSSQPSRTCSERARWSPAAGRRAPSGRASSSGDEGLDRILGGGLPMNGINLIMGLPGSGRRSCASSSSSRARPRRARRSTSPRSPSRSEDPPLRPDAQLLRSRRDRPVDLLRGPRPHRGRRERAHRRHRAITALIKERRPGIIAIDSFKALAAFADDARGSDASSTISPHCSRPSPPPASGSGNTARTRRARRRSSPWPTGSSRSRPSARTSARYA